MVLLGMKHILNRKILKREGTEKSIIIIASTILIYLLISLYFSNHFFFNTEVNGINLSLKAYHDADQTIKNHINDYELQIIERNGEIEVITGQEIGMHFNEKNSILKIHQLQNALKWSSAFFKDQKYYDYNLSIYDQDKLMKRINNLNCINRQIIEPQNVEFKYVKGTYEVEKEVIGNKLVLARLTEAIETNIVKGKTNINLEDMLCYENPKYTISSDKTLQTKNLLNTYVSTKITYLFDRKNEILDGTTINKWLRVDENLDVVISNAAVLRYVKELSNQYDTVGTTRTFKSSTGKMVEINGGLYGWMINQEIETKELLENIKSGKAIEKEPSYAQKALIRGENDIGSTYIEINISRQKLWFYKDGTLITQGAVVTGNPNRGYATVLGTYMLNYKQNLATLQGPGYEVKVTYWMPFFGNMGIHDATWRYAFGGEIYKIKGTHGCVNAPFYLAKTIFENIEVGTPVICYEEKTDSIN